MKKAIRKPQLRVLSLSAAFAQGWLQHGALRWRCALGRSGQRALKREGDGATPIGRFRLVQAFYRADRIGRPGSGLPLRSLRRDDGWCDGAGDRNYNRLVKHPYAAPAEKLWREDGLYDLIVVLDYNLRPRVQGRGSAIFLHCAREGFAATEGCVAVRRADLIRLLRCCSRGTAIATGTAQRRRKRPEPRGPGQF